MEYPFQAKVVGKGTVPKAYHYSRWGFLRELIKNLSGGQAIRIVIPKGTSLYGVRMAWSKYTQEKKVYGKTRAMKQVDDSHIMYLWYIPEQ